jgi:phenol 2-monooxygenase
MSLLKTVSNILLPVRKQLSNNVSHQYEFERRKYAQDLIAFDKEYAHLFSAKPQTADNPNGVSQEVFQR